MLCILRKAVLPTLFLLALSVTANAQTVISTYPYNGFLGGGGSLVGQTFTAPTDNVLTSFSYQMLFQITSPVPLGLSIYAYNPVTNTLLGSALYTSGPINGTKVQGISNYTFNTSNLILTTGSVYAAIHDNPLFSNVGANFGPPDAYTGGTLILSITPNSFYDYSASSGAPVDTTFVASFVSAASVPEPGSVALLVGLTTVGANLLRKRRARKIRGCSGR